MITVDDKDISTNWGLEPYRDNFYSAIMKDAGLKDRIIGDFPDTSGVIVPKGQSYTKSQEIVVSFLCDSYEHYRAFLTYCVAQKVVSMYVSETDETLRLEYLACSSFNKAGNNNIFAVKFQEANPMRRYGIFPFCAPEGFDVERQPVDIAAKYHEYNNVDKRYIFSLRDDLTKFALLMGTSLFSATSIIHGYELNGVEYRETYNPLICTRTTTILDSYSTEIIVDSTDGFDDSGTIWVGDYWFNGEFVYTSKTPTSFVGESQFVYRSYSGLKVVKMLTLKGTKRWVLALSSATNIHVQLTAVLGTSTLSDWVYVGKNCQSIADRGSGIGGGCLKYIHCEDENSITYNNGLSVYLTFGGYLTGVLKIPKGLKRLGQAAPAYSYGAMFQNNVLITSVIIHKDVLFIGASTFIGCSGISRYDFYPLVAPAVRDVAFSNYAKPLHIKPLSTGYDVSPWTNTAIFSSIIRDL